MIVRRKITPCRLFSITSAGLATGGLVMRRRRFVCGCVRYFVVGNPADHFQDQYMNISRTGSLRRLLPLLIV